MNSYVGLSKSFPSSSGIAYVGDGAQAAGFISRMGEEGIDH